MKRAGRVKALEPSPAHLSPEQLDDILSLQLTVGWAGETPRLGWWKSDFIDRDGGGDFVTRLLPQTAAWASLQLAREAARRVDERARQRIAGGDGVWTLFHFGFDVNEQLDDRLAAHKAARALPIDVLVGPRFLVGWRWSREVFATILTTFGVPKVAVTPAGRRLVTDARAPIEVASLLAAALFPIARAYPMPYVER